jgi:hypothetical protein
MATTWVSEGIVLTGMLKLSGNLVVVKKLGTGCYAALEASPADVIRMRDGECDGDSMRCLAIGKTRRECLCQINGQLEGYSPL